jgi:hypothetical protein
MARRNLLFHLAVMVSNSFTYKAFARELSTSSQQLMHDIRHAGLHDEYSVDPVFISLVIGSPDSN